MPNDAQRAHLSPLDQPRNAHMLAQVLRSIDFAPMTGRKRRTETPEGAAGADPSNVLTRSFQSTLFLVRRYRSPLERGKSARATTLRIRKTRNIPAPIFRPFRRLIQRYDTASCNRFFSYELGYPPLSIGTVLRVNLSNPTESESTDIHLDSPIRSN